MMASFPSFDSSSVSRLPRALPPHAPASGENNPNSALNHFGKHPSWEVLRNAKNGTNPCQCFSKAGNFHTPVSQMMSVMTRVSNPDRHLMKVLVLFLNPQMTADGSFWLIWTYQVCSVQQRGNWGLLMSAQTLRTPGTWHWPNEGG